MASISGLFGGGGGANGTGFAGPQSANTPNATNAQQINTAYGNVQNQMGGQANLLSALQAQQGLQNQSNTYNQMGNTAQQYQNIANGTGPNPAQTMLNQATGANTANQAALMAGQRGAGANAGLIARQAAQQGAANQQAAIGQGATMQANQQIAGLQGLSGQQVNMAGLANTMASNQIGQTNANTQAQQAEQQNLIGAQNASNSNQTAMQSNVNSANAGLANTQLQGQQATFGGLMQGLGSGIKSLLADGGVVEDPQTNFSDFQGASESAPAPNTSVAPMGADSGASALASGMGSMMGGSSSGKSGGSSGGMGSIMGLLAMMAEGGTVQRFDEGGVVATQPVSNTPQSEPTSKFGKFLKGASKQQTATGKSDANAYGGNSGAQAIYNGMSSLSSALGTALAPSKPQPQAMAGGPMDNTNIPTNDSNTLTAAKGGKVPALLSPGERYLTPKKAKEVVGKGKDPIKEGKLVPGKPKVGGAKNSYANDVVPAKLEEGGIVIPRSITKGKNPKKQAMKFVAAHLRGKK